MSTSIVIISIALCFIILAIIAQLFGAKKKSKNKTIRDYEKVKGIPDRPQKFSVYDNPCGEIDLDKVEECMLQVVSPPIHAPLINKGNIMGKFSAFMIGFLIASLLSTLVALSYFLFCPHAKHKTIIIQPKQMTPNHMMPEIPKRMSPLGGMYD